MHWHLGSTAWNMWAVQTGRVCFKKLWKWCFSLRKKSAFDKKFEIPQLQILLLPGTNCFIQSRGWTRCMYRLAQSWVWCWLFQYLSTERANLQVSLSLTCYKVTVSGCTAGRGRTAPEVHLATCSAPRELHHLRHSTGRVCNRRMEATLPKGVPDFFCASQTSLWASSGGSKWGKGWGIISFPSQTSYYCFGQFIPLRMHKANKPCSP